MVGPTTRITRSSAIICGVSENATLSRTCVSAIDFGVCSRSTRWRQRSSVRRFVAQLCRNRELSFRRLECASWNFGEVPKTLPSRLHTESRLGRMSSRSRF